MLTKPESRTIAGLAFLALFASANAETVKEVRAVIASNSVERIPRHSICRYYDAWYVDNCTVAEREAILERNIAAHRRWMELAPKDACAAQADLGGVFATVGRWKDAKPELAAAIAAGDKLDFKRRVKALWDMANCLWVEGDKEGAKKLVAEVGAVYGTGKLDDFLSITGKSKFLSMMFAGEDEDLDTLKLPHSVDGKPFPTPQEAKYGNGKVSLAKVDLQASGLKSDDQIARLLKRKLSRFGSKFEKGGTKVAIEISPDAPVDKPQGYTLDVKDGGVSIKARDRLGATWGAVSLIQCVDRGALAISECAIRDWPKCERRGALPYWYPDFLEFALFTKMSCVTINMGREWVLLPLDCEMHRLYAERLCGFGMEAYFNIRDIAMQPLLPYTSPRTWEMHLERARFIASCGVGVCFHLDDHRFPMHPADLKAAGTAANLDADYMTRLYREVKSEYPGFKLQYGPPFYWGPDGGVAYPEDRDTYLRSLGEKLDPEIDVYWTGPRVKTHYMTEEKTKWYSNLIGRKPMIFHNGNAIGQHNYIQYGADPTGYKTSHATNIFDCIAAFQQNVSHHAEGGEAGSAMDWCWNPDAHDGRESVRRAVDQIEGPGVFEIVEAATPSLSYFDKYGYCVPRGELFAEDQADLDKRVADADAAWNKVLAIAKNGGMFVEGFKTVTGWGRKLADYKRNPPDWLKKQYEAAKANTKFAVEDIGFDESKGDQFLPAELLQGGTMFNGIKDSTGKKRDIKLITTGEETGGRFTCEPFPNYRPFKMFVVGMRYLDRWEKPPKVAPPEMEVEVNGRVVWRGAMFSEDVYKPVEIEIPVEAINRGNTFKIRNAGPFVKDQGRPVIHYVVLRK